MHRSKSIILLQLIALISFSFAAVINESTKTTCPADPTFRGKCHLKQVKNDGPSCKTINGVKVCRNWWKKEYIYECEGQDNSALFNTFENQSYCRLVSRCKTWEDVSLKGGKVSCRIYIDKNRPGCETNPNRAECVADDCGDLKNKCTFLEYIPFGNIADKANPTYEQYCDPVSGGCGYKEVPGASGINLGTYVYECPSDVRKVCREYEQVLKCPAECPDGTKVDCPDNSNQATCPDGSIATCKTETCNTTKTCIQYKTVNVQGTELKTCLAPRSYIEHVVYKNSTEDYNLANRPECIAIGNLSETKNVIGRFVWGWDGDCGDDCGSCESYITGLKIIDNGRDLGVWQECLMVNGSPGIFPSSSQIRTFFNMYLQNYLHIPATVISVGSVRNTGSYAGSRTCFGADCAASRFREVSLTILIEKRKYQCFQNSIDTSNCSSLSGNCQLQDNLNDLSSLACNKFAIDVNNSNKNVCSEFAIQYECPTTITKQQCIKYETKSVCNGVSYPVRSVEVENKDFSNDFNKAIALAQLANELKHVWAGKYMRCDKGWFSSVFENPMEYFKQKMVSFIVFNLGPQFLSAANTFVQDYLGSCLSPAVAGVDFVAGDATAISQESVADCMGSAAGQAWSDAGDNSMMKSMLEKMGLNSGAASFLTSPYGQLAISVAIDILTQTEKCNACTSKSCAEAHGFYNTYGLIKGGNCHFVESGCAWKVKYGVGSVCLRKKYMYCCYDSVFARILVEQAYQQLGYSFAGGNCSALTFDDIKKLDFSKMDFTELQNYLEAKMKGQIDPNLIKNKINNYFDSDYGTQNFTGETPYNN